VDLNETAERKMSDWSIERPAGSTITAGFSATDWKPEALSDKWQQLRSACGELAGQLVEQQLVEEACAREHHVPPKVNCAVISRILRSKAVRRMRRTLLNFMPRHKTAPGGVRLSPMWTESRKKTGR
jgi:hypothetical protein